MSLVDPATSKPALSKKDKPTGGVKLKKSIAKKTKPKDTESNGELQTDQYTSHSIIISLIIVLQEPRQVALLGVLLQILLPSMALVRKPQTVKASPNATTARNPCPSPLSLLMPHYAIRRRKSPVRRRRPRKPRPEKPKRRKPPKKRTKTVTP